MTNQLRATDGIVESETLDGGDVGDTGGQYDNGGTTISTDLGRVDDAVLEVDNPAYQAVVTGTSGTTITFELHEATVDTTTSNASESVSWAEVSDNTDISNDSFTYVAVRQ